ncbi:Outer membrane protein TolC [Desulfacinum hydrothermale DSM 13146]|uniref:Outer membrane protein TolC n=1 Tax=Desulfacinum hydrothermale DSM 13146 TaxID=1121390 RepID=A0A1W1XDK8_9BACT|nr:TolC family protein [Desulfacinum hydrothermale]SMC21973.1 Outer membrane protein TolC [Desulfacinum hydrothermale DSM 13146]
MTLKTIRTILFAPAFLILIGWPTASGSALTLQEAVREGLQVHPAVAAARRDWEAAKAQWQATLSPYLPSLDWTASAEEQNTGGERDHVERSSLSMSYTIFDGGRRRTERDVAMAQLDQARLTLRRTRLDVVRDISAAFVQTLAAQQILKERILQVEDAATDLKVAQGRYRLGVALKSDVLQASVRLEEARFEKVRAEGDWNKAAAELWSLLGRPLKGRSELAGSLEPLPPLADRDHFLALSEKRPVVLNAEQEVKAAQSRKQGTTAPFLPTVSAQASYAATHGSGIYESVDDEHQVGLTATWNLFRLDKFYDRRAASYQLHASRARLADRIRQVRLECHNRYEDVVTAQRSVAAAQEALRQSLHNYRQALGEYRVGKGSILALVQAESALAAARIRRVQSLENYWIARIELERAAGSERIVALPLKVSPQRGEVR